MNENIQSTPYLPVQGLCTDTTLENTPEGNMSFSLNLASDSNEGGQGSLVSENANRLCVELPQGFIERGSANIDSKTLVKLGYVQVDDTITSYVFIIDLENCTYQTKLESTCANIVYPLTLETRVIKGCERVIYWSDSNGPDKYLNLDKVTTLNPDCNLLNLNPDITPVDISLVSVNDTGGYLPIGTYAIQVEQLTSNQEPVYRSYISPTVPVTDDPLNLAYDSINGALNIDTNLADVGGVPITNKSITFNIDNLDIRFPYFRINVVSYVNSDGQTPTAYRIGTLFPINGASSTFTLTGFNGANGDTFIDYASINIPFVKYESSRALEQVQNRLLKANLKENSRDYSGYQKTTNQITSKPVIRQVSVNDQFSLGDSKNPNTYWESVGYQSDETYPFGIVYVHSNGEESPVFHIPGRESTVYDTELLVVGTDVPIEETRHLGLTAGESIERWKVFNTGNANQFSYHESDSGTYPTITDCNGSYIFGELSGQKVRYHKFPSRKEIPLVDGDMLNILGIEFDNIQYPDSDIVGHYIVRGKRDSVNRTVLDSGYLKPLLEDTEFVTYLASNFAFGDISTMNFGLITPKLLTNKEYLNATHVVVPFNIEYEAQEDLEIIEGWEVVAANCTQINSTTSVISNRAINGNLIMAPRAIQNNVVDFGNRNLENASRNLYMNFVSTYDDIADGGLDFRLHYAVVKKEFDVFGNILNIIYYRTHSEVLEGTSSTVFGGDVFISKIDIEEIYRYSESHERVEGNYFGNLWVESEINLGYRVQGIIDCNRYFQYLSDDSNDILRTLQEYFLNKVTDDSYNGVPIRSICPASYRINPDLNRLQYDTYYNSLWLGYDYCSKCLKQYKNHIAFSEKSFQNDLGDNYRNTLANNFIDLGSDRGGITSMTYRNNKLIVRMEDGLTVLFPNPQVMQTDQSNVYIGTGDFLSLPDNEIMRSDSGYAGQQSIHAECLTPFGIAWADETRGKIFVFDEQLEEISRYKMYHWFSKNLPSFIKGDFKKYGIGYNPDEFGIRMTYDPKFERLIVHKKDFRLTKVVKDLIDSEPSATKEVKPGGLQVGTQFLPFIIPDFFENKSWTISYSFRTKTWISWHSYQPDYMSFGSTTFYSTLGNTIWAHDEYHRFHEYFGKKFPFIVEFVDKHFITSNTHAIHYWAYAESYDGDTSQWGEEDVTFDKAIFYTNDQSSGLVSLEVPSNEFESTKYFTDRKWAIQTDKNWKIASIRDVATGSPTNSSAWADIQSYYNSGNGYIDKVPKNVNLNIDQYLQDEFRDKWICVRLFFNDTSKKMTINLLVTNNFPSIR